LACGISEKLDTNNCNFAHLTLILSLHYAVKCRSRSLAVYNNARVAGVNAKITETSRSLKICNIFNTYRNHFRIVLRRNEMAHQQRVSCSGSCVIERAVGRWR